MRCLVFSLVVAVVTGRSPGPGARFDHRDTWPVSSFRRPSASAYRHAIGRRRTEVYRAPVCGSG